MKLALYNPHIDDFLACPPHFPILRRRALKKYGFLIEEKLDKSDTRIVFYDSSLSAFIPVSLFGRLPYFIRKIVAEIEMFFWIRINKVDRKTISVTSDPKDLKGAVLFAMSYKCALGDIDRRMSVFATTQFNIFHLSHYFLNTRKKSENLSKIPNLFLAGDSDITDNKYFQKHFQWYKNRFLVLPFAVQDRFVQKEPIGKKINKCVATGTFHRLDQEATAQLKEFTEFYAIDTYHPVRKAIYNSRNKYKEHFDCKVSLFRDYEAKKNLGGLIKRFQVSQKGYFKNDIVEVYNSYSYAVVGEEITGFPGIGSFEAMACGCVLIAVPEYYIGLGLKSGEHFICYNGDISLIPGILEKTDDITRRYISENAMRYVNEKFRSKGVCFNWFHVVSGLSNQ